VLGCLLVYYNNDARRMPSPSSLSKQDVRGLFMAGKSPGRCREARAAGYPQGTHPQPRKRATSPLTTHYPHRSINDGNTAPTTTAASHCSQGGWWVLTATLTTGQRQQQRPPTRQHPPPRCERLLAGGIAGANGHVNTNEGTTTRTPTTGTGQDDEDPSTHLHRCERLLAGWIGGC
jgi:hypothetical protein